jgi:periplasmic protein TonB
LYIRAWPVSALACLLARGLQAAYADFCLQGCNVSLIITGDAAGAAPASWTIVEDAPLGKGVRFAVVLGLHLLFILGLLHVQEPPAAESEPIRMAVRVIERPAPATEQQTLTQAPEVPVESAPAPPVRPPEPRPVAVREPVAVPTPLAVVPAPPAPAPAEPRAPAPPPPAMTAVRFDAAYLNNPAPGYPLQSRRRGEQGQVLLRVQVDAQGLPEQVEIHQGSGHARLDAAALEAVRRWRFVPARRGDEAIAASVLVPILFRME